MKFRLFASGPAPTPARSVGVGHYDSWHTYSWCDSSWCMKEPLQDSRRLSGCFIVSKFSSNQNANHSRSLFDRLRNH
jgi:hypothetical protein